MHKTTYCSDIYVVFIIILNSGTIHADCVFSVDSFFGMPDSYKAVEKTISEIREMENIRAYTHPKYKDEYLYNTKTKTAVLLKCVSKISKKLFVKKPRKSDENPNDIMNRTITTVSGYISVQNFFKAFDGYVLCVPSGHKVHETCFFFKKNGEKLDIIFYNPNSSYIQDGTESNNVAKAFVNHFGKKRRSSVLAYHDITGNEFGKCCALAWEQISNFICLGLSPFKRKNISLEPFDGIMSETSRKRYRNDPNYVWNNIETWKKGDNIMKKATGQDVVDITLILSNLITDFYIQLIDSSAN